MKYFIPVIFSILLMSCTNSPKYDINENKYEKSKEDISVIERKAPQKFLDVQISSKKNLLKQTVVKVNLFNKAKIVAYKDIHLKLRFYSKTAALLEEDQDTVYEEINPGASIKFKSKYFTPRGTDSVSVSIVSATPVN